MAARDGFDFGTRRVGLSIFGEIHLPLIEAERERAVGAVAAEHAHHGVADLPWAIALDGSFHDVRTKAGSPSAKEQPDMRSDVFTAHSDFSFSFDLTIASLNISP